MPTTSGAQFFHIIHPPPLPRASLYRRTSSECWSGYHATRQCGRAVALLQVLFRTTLISRRKHTYVVEVYEGVVRANTLKKRCIRVEIYRCRRAPAYVFCLRPRGLPTVCIQRCALESCSEPIHPNVDARRHQTQGIDLTTSKDHTCETESALLSQGSSRD